MNLQNLLKELDTLNLPIDQYAITSSGPMAARDMREANDLDIIVTDKLWRELAQKYTVTERPLGPVIYISELVQVIGNFYPNKSHQVRSNEQQIQEAELFLDHPFVILEDVIRFKQALGREKDKTDLDLINHYLSQKRED